MRSEGAEPIVTPNWILENIGKHTRVFEGDGYGGSGLGESNLWSCERHAPRIVMNPAQPRIIHYTQNVRFVSDFFFLG